MSRRGNWRRQPATAIEGQGIMTLWRSVFFLLKVAVVIAVAVFLANYPGDISLFWFQHRIDMPIGLAIGAIILLVLALLGLLRLWHFLRRAPREVAAARSNSRKAKGYRALTRGLTAAAAGDATEARKQARIAHDYLKEPALTLLLAAQAAQLNGEDSAAERYFLALSRNPESALLGLRGLITSALKRGDEATALQYVEQAVTTAPQAAWASETAHRLHFKNGEYDAAERSLSVWTRNGGIPVKAAQRRRAVLLTEKARQLLVPGEAENASVDLAAGIQAAREAVKLAADFVPARLVLAQLLIRQGKGREAARLIEQAWDSSPHPLLARVFARAESNETPLDRARRLERLARQNPDHPDSHRAVAEMDLAAQLWGEARRHLDKLTELERAAGGEANQSTARLWARLEEGERANMATARDWLERAAVLPADPVWLCAECGAPGEAGPACGHWQAICPNCGGIDSLAWKRPAQLSQQLLGNAPAVAEDKRALTAATRPAGPAPQVVAPAAVAAGQPGRPFGAAEPEISTGGSSVDAARLVN
jgi:HemY protein